MFIFIGLVVIVIACMVIGSSTHEEIVGAFCFVVGALCSVLFLVTLITLPMNRYEVYGQIEQFKSVQTTLNTARENGDDLEDAAMQIEVMKSNSWLADKQYWNTTIFDMWIPDAVNELEPIK